MSKLKVVLYFYKHCVSFGKIRKTEELAKGHIHSYHISFKGFVEFLIKCAKQRNNI